MCVVVYGGFLLGRGMCGCVVVCEGGGSICCVWLCVVGSCVFQAGGESVSVRCVEKSCGCLLLCMEGGCVFWSGSAATSSFAGCYGMQNFIDFFSCSWSNGAVVA